MKIQIFKGTVDAAADLETEIALTEAQKDALAAAILFGGGAVLRVKTGTKTGNPTALLTQMDVSFETSGDIWRKAQACALEAALATGAKEYEGPELYAKVLAMRPARLRLVWSTETLDGGNSFAACDIAILVEDRA